MCWKQLLAITIVSATFLPTIHAQSPAPTGPAEGVLRRLMPHLAPQFELALVPKPDHKDYFRISGTRGHIRVEAATQPTVLYGVNWYLKYVAHSLFNSQPSLTARRAATWAPDVLRYNPADFAHALTELLQVAPALRSTETYRYDLVDVARQAMANESRRLLPLIKQAYEARDKAAFASLTKEWLHDMKLQNNLLKTNQFFLLGRWLSFVPPWASSPAELDRLNYDARSILTTWGDRHASEYGLHEYGNRDWAGLTSDYYMPRWQMYFDSLSTSLATGEPPKAIDWYAFGDRWNHSQKLYDVHTQGDSYTAAFAIARALHLAPNQPPEAHK